ncbi:MAG: hypothetical protein JXR88_04105 [Clostridia bacterium]|nr:hypothetical protein [Clostridia bacterium]
MFYYLHVIAYLIYTFIMLKLISTSIYSSFIEKHYVFTGLKIFVFIFLCYEIFNEYFKYLRKKKTELTKQRPNHHTTWTLVLIFLGTMLSFTLNHTFHLGAVVSSSLVGILGVYFFKTYQVPIYCGSFAGMVSITIIPDFWMVSLVGLLTGLLYIIGQEVFKGFGGKLGATAYFGTLLASFLSGTLEHSLEETLVQLSPWMFVFFTLGAILTFYLNVKFHIGVVLSSSLIGLMGGVSLPFLFSNGSTMALTLFCGTFIGMSAAEKLCFKKCIVLASLLGAIIFAYTLPFFPGLGGKLGLIAFSASVATAGYYNLKDQFIKKMIIK